ncbi:MAG: response regulator [Proteobacteria bacterium]|nr:response regulator [Pseudomonadota bacterium]MBU1688412.1 response regulator [Pseudomonadota bacterium]
MPSKKILIVDDEEDILWSLQQFLSNKDLDIDILTANSGEKALEVLANNRVELVITDIKMPGMSGLDLLTEIKNRYPHISVIVMTAFPSNEFKRDATLKGSLYFIEKPFDINILRNKISELLKKKNQFKGTVSGISLADVIQIKCMSRVTAALRVIEDDRQGIIYFNDGQIVHALCDDLDGELAFYEIMSFSNGILDSIETMDIPEPTITMPYAALLMESARREDEQSQPPDTRPDQKPTPAEPSVTAPLTTPVSTPATGPCSNISEYYLRMIEIPGYSFSVFITTEGKILCADPDAPLGLPEISTLVLHNFLKLARKASELLGFGKRLEISISSKKGFAIIHPLDPETDPDRHLITLFSSTGKLALARIKVEKQIPTVASLIPLTPPK